MSPEVRFRIRRAAGWLLIAYGAIGLVGSLAPLYLLLTGQVAPGKAYSPNDLAPTVEEAAISVTVYLGIVVGGLLLLPRRLSTKAPNHLMQPTGQERPAADQGR